MGDFKRNSSRFSRSGGSSEGAAPRGASSGRPARTEGSNSGGYQRRQGGSGGQSGGKDFPFSRVASMTVPKSASDDTAEFVMNDLRGSDLSLTAKVYLGKGDNELTLKNGDMLLISFKTNDKDKDFVVGHVSVKN